MDPWRVTPPRDRRDRRDRRNVIKFCWGQLQLSLEEQSLALATLAQNCEPMVMSFGRPQELRAELPLSRHYKETLGRRGFCVDRPCVSLCLEEQVAAAFVALFRGWWLVCFSMFQLGDCEINKINKSKRWRKKTCLLVAQQLQGQEQKKGRQEERTEGR